MSPCASTAAATSPISMSEKYSAEPNLSATSASGGPASAISSVPTVPAKNEPMRGDRERRSRAALPRHLVAVEAGHHRRGLARQVHQDGGGRAAVLGAVIDAGEHDQRAHRRDAVGDRHQHRDGAERADARQHADQRADRHADQAVEQVLQRDRDPKPKIRLWNRSMSVVTGSPRSADKAGQGPR